MPISFDRLHAMLLEHEDILRIAGELYETIKQVAKDPEFSLEGKLFDITAQIERLRHLPNYAHALERQMYNRNVKRNIYARDYQRRKRRKRGMLERQPVGSPQEVESKFLADREYHAAMSGMLPSEGPNVARHSSEDFSGHPNTRTSQVE